MQWVTKWKTKHLIVRLISPVPIGSVCLPIHLTLTLQGQYLNRIEERKEKEEQALLYDCV